MLKRPSGLVKTEFGDMFEFQTPPSTNGVIICAVTPHGYRPVDMCLSHQVYRDKILALMTEHGCREVLLVPFSHEDYISIDMVSLRLPAREP